MVEKRTWGGNKRCSPKSLLKREEKKSFTAGKGMGDAQKNRKRPWAHSVALLPRHVQLASILSFFLLWGSSESDSELESEPPSKAEMVLPFALVYRLFSVDE